MNDQDYKCMGGRVQHVFHNGWIKKVVCWNRSSIHLHDGRLHTICMDHAAELKAMRLTDEEAEIFEIMSR